MPDSPDTQLVRMHRLGDIVVNQALAASPQGQAFIAKMHEHGRHVTVVQ